jgi:hypothetical protein
MLERAEREAWAAEFQSLGADRIRSEVVLGRWPKEKRSFAREWLERQDVRDWQERKPGAGLAGLRSYRRIWGIIAGLIFGGFALVRVLRQFKLGM